MSIKDCEKTRQLLFQIEGTLCLSNLQCKKGKCPIHNGTLLTCNWLIRWKKSSFFQGKSRPRRFPKSDFPIVTIFKWQLLKCANSQAATFHRLGWAFWGDTGCDWGRALRLRWSREPSAVARTGLGNCTSGKLPLGKIPLGSCWLRKTLWGST